MQESIAADLFVTSGSPVSAGGQSLPMSPAVGDKHPPRARAWQAALPVRMRQQYFRDTQILMIAAERRAILRDRQGAQPAGARAWTCTRPNARPDAVIISENFAVLHGVGAGDT